jgi:hypothetical protein
LLEGLTNEMEDLIFETEPQFFSIGSITILDETVSLLNVGVSKNRKTKESNPKQGHCIKEQHKWRLQSNQKTFMSNQRYH